MIALTLYKYINFEDKTVYIYEKTAISKIAVFSLIKITTNFNSYPLAIFSV